MGNQQERFDLDLAWLTGIIEGEGWISLLYYKSNQKNGRYTPALMGKIGMVNCDFLITEKVRSIFDVLDIKHIYNFRKAFTGSDNISRKEKVEVSVTSQKSLRILCNTIIPFMVGEKKKRAVKLLEFLDIRSKKPKSGPLSKYGKEEFILYKEMYTYKGKSRSKILNDLTLDEILKNFEDKV